MPLPDCSTDPEPKRIQVTGRQRPSERRAAPPRRVYDHRLRELTCQSEDPRLFAHLGVPRSTAATWIRRGAREVVSAKTSLDDPFALQLELRKLQKRHVTLLAIVRLLFTLVRVLGVRLDTRLPDGAAKAKLLDATSRATRSIPLAVALRVLGLSPSRYHAWRNRGRQCLLTDRTSCPKNTPTQLTSEETRTIHDLVTSETYRHIPVSSLAIYAQRLKKVFASPSTWHRLVREYGWRRPRRRLHPAKPSLGQRASRPNELWHIDVTAIRLVDGTRVFLHAVIDNFSRRILAWKAALRLDPLTTCEVLTQASETLSLAEPPATVVADSGVENVNREVDALLGQGRLRRVLAQVEVAYSNSMIESWWRSLKHNWLYLHTLDSLAAVERLVAFFVREHNSLIPHSAFDGRTPDEMYFKTGNGVPEQLAAARLVARQERTSRNRGLPCEDCRAPPTGQIPAPSPDFGGISATSQLRQFDSGMS